MDLNHLREYYPELYEEFTGIKVLPTIKTSVAAAYSRFCRDTGFHYISYKVMVDPTGEKIPLDQCLVFAVRLVEWDKCEEALFFVDLKRYIHNLTPFGYVVDEDVDERRELL